MRTRIGRSVHHRGRSAMLRRALVARAAEGRWSSANVGTNWAGNHAYVARALHEPRSLDELQELVRRGRSLRVLGSRHSFNDIADTTGDLVSLARLPRVFELDRSAGTVTVDGGVRYGELCGPLHAAGFALHNLASLPHISVAGACATATHGSGDRSGNLATAVTAVELLRADGEVVTLVPRRRTPRRFPARSSGSGRSASSRGSRSASSRRSRCARTCTRTSRSRAVADHFDEITALADSVSLFTEWRGPVFEEVWLKRRVDPARRLRAAADAPWRDPRDRPDPPDPPDARRRVHGAARGARAVARAPAALPDGPHAERRCGAADRVPAAAAARGRRAARRRRPARPDRPAPAGLRGPDGRRRRPLDEHGRRPRVGRAALHLAAGLAERPRAAAGARGGARAVRAATALGKALDDGARGDPGRVPAAAATSRRSSTASTPTARSRTTTCAGSCSGDDGVGRPAHPPAADLGRQPRGPASPPARSSISAFGPGLEERFTTTDWDHSLGGTHFLADLDGSIVAHASVIEREIEVGGLPLRTGYVEAVAVAPGRQGQGIGSRLMEEVDALIDERFELGVLGTGRHAFYERLGWMTWRGQAFVRTPDGPEADPRRGGLHPRPLDAVHAIARPRRVDQLRLAARRCLVGGGARDEGPARAAAGPSGASRCRRTTSRAPRGAGRIARCRTTC